VSATDTAGAQGSGYALTSTGKAAKGRAFIGGLRTSDTPGTTVIDNLRQAGWSWEGLTTKSAQPRFLYRLALPENYDAAFASFDVSARTAIRRAREHALSPRRLGRDELDVFKRILEETAERKGFADRSMAYYQALCDAFGEDAFFMVMELDSAVLRDRLATKIAELKRARDDARGKGRKQQISDQIVAAAKLLAKAGDFPEQSGAVPVNAGLFIRQGGELVYLFGGSRSAYLCLNAVYLLQEHMMRRCYDWGIRHYNFYGVSGVFDPADATYGVLAFKQAFGGYIDELIGDFTLVLDPLRYRAGQLAGRLRRTLH
jgi:alanine adding enzyme